MSSDQLTKSTPGLSRGLLLLLAVVAGFMVSNIYYGQPLLERIGFDLSIPAASIGWVVASSQAGYLVGLVLLVPLGDLVDRRILITVQVAASAVGACGVTLASSQAALLLAFGILGLASSVVQAIVAYTAASSTPDKRGGNIGTVTAGVVSGLILARTVAGGMTDLWGWRSVYIFAAVAAVVLSVAVLRAMPREQTSRGEARYWQAVSSVVVLTRRNPVFRTRALITMLLFASFGVLWSGMSLSAQRPRLEPSAGRCRALWACRSCRDTGRIQGRCCGRPRMGTTGHGHQFGGAPGLVARVVPGELVAALVHRRHRGAGRRGAGRPRDQSDHDRGGRRRVSQQHHWQLHGVLLGGKCRGSSQPLRRYSTPGAGPVPAFWGQSSRWALW